MSELLGATKGYCREVNGALQAALKAWEQEQKQKKKEDKAGAKPPELPATPAKVTVASVCKSLHQIGTPMTSIVASELPDGEPLPLAQPSVVRVTTFTSSSAAGPSEVQVQCDAFKKAFEEDKALHEGKSGRAQQKMSADAAKQVETTMAKIVGDAQFAQVTEKRGGFEPIFFGFATLLNGETRCNLYAETKVQQVHALNRALKAKTIMLRDMQQSEIACAGQDTFLACNVPMNHRMCIQACPD